MTILISNRTDEVIRQLNVAIWSSVLFGLIVLASILVQPNATASVSTGPDNVIDMSSTTSLDPSNRVAREYKEIAKTLVVQDERRPSRSVTRERLRQLYSHLPHPNDLGRQIDLAAAKYAVDAKLILSICVSESHLRAKVRNKSGATGICQVMAKMHGHSAKDLLDYRINIDAATKIIADLNKQCRGRTACVIQAYNTGWGAYSKGARAPQYLAKVRSEMRKHPSSS
ncbi:hypothetical protein pEaSNUABM14_00308 [Erwinia phage pEa_SNUABM_14]|uniref:Transglycosylase SLT domain-containing protein n=1 Tax=Erwinia phage pEa_SNUABM_7 TaxID=2866695 RepID=A0AAE7WTA1_9CAUD|nr:transglycosylase [Erwinia phage pEa_SNUABM_7]QYW03267.1 hypothetical protein pEaSNUABM13_00308 [Erwinia phage pEa_SNUABM_13]QYW03608.1 hypothetical protein pEaSNUABM34_00306 [Erwinia phage pEa_SNUABM_34]QYW03949.1 hypothetical protein pEaSNUABM45_00306 [Erwinia phage pEa_SNUABM_45]QYW04290.1 hypothetical protein pEaSNUABM46_00306 [Erwinia phage pEa_SNUABM_46]QYW04633.1 hypothetical protein pEaSNUABM14_00308 [Erwinia phage pEa_SNUABM_14]QYW05321.1 hypothetical protein pEaSNUABM21_00307 [Erw